MTPILYQVHTKAFSAPYVAIVDTREGTRAPAGAVTP